ncbi:MAG: DnaJ domain-containing protein [Phycisphaerales bacterium]|jgi:DnaJ-domain-containing protein 1|nr:DnaJ domain-containing protein [Phycisphaerales bacterium]
MRTDAFDLLGLAPAFDLDRSVIDRAFLARAVSVHPDMAGGDSEAEALSARLNDAKRALLDPETRANLLLARLGGPSADREKSLPSTLLMEVMEAREGIDAARASGDSAELARWKAWAVAGRESIVKTCRQLIAQALAAETSPETRLLREIRVQLNAWRSYERMIEQMDAR